MVGNSDGGVPRGTQLNGIYEIESLIAQGGMGEVYSGRAIQTGDRVAIKMILPEHANNQTIVDLFRREASTLHNLFNEAIVRYYVFSVDPTLGRPYLAMEFVDGPSIKDLMRNGPMGLGELDVLRRRLSLGLHAAHQLGVIHRDISPDNVILPGGSVNKAKIIDFGIAKSTEAGDGTLIGSGMAGKLNYVSPEQLGLFGGDVTGKSDMYSLGLVLAAASIGEPINMGGSQAEVVEKRRVVPDLSRVPSEIRPLIEAMVQPDPAQRPASLAEVAEFDLSKIPGGGRRNGGGGSKKGGGGFLIVLAVLAVLGSIGGALWYVGALDKIIGAGGEPTPTPPLDPIPTPGPDAPTATPVPTAAPAPSEAPGAGAPSAVPGTATASNAMVGRSYRWMSNAFTHATPQLLVLDIEGQLPAGLRFEDTGTGQAVLYGVPSAEGRFEVTIVARDPDGREGRLEVTIEVDPAPVVVLTPVPPTPMPTVPPATTPTEGVPTPTPGGLFSRPPTPIPTLEPSPVPPTPAPPTPAPPTPAPPTPEPPTPEPTAAPEPTSVPTPVPPTPSPVPQAPTPVPPTSAPPTPTVPEQTNNRPPLIPDQVRTAVPLDSGSDVNIRIGSFADTEDGTNLDIEVEGQLPPGLLLNRAAGGVVALYGRPSAPGTYSFAITATDSGGAKASIPVTIVVTGTGPTAAPIEPTAVPSLPTSAPLPGARTRAYIAGYDGGDCFIAQPLEVSDSSAQVAVLAATTDPILVFNEAFIRDMGFEANINAAVISPEQCALARALTPQGRASLGSDLSIRLLKEDIASGEIVSGRLQNSNADVRLFVSVSDGSIIEVTDQLQGGSLFSFQFAGSGYQVVVAIRPSPGEALPAQAGLLDLVQEVNAGRAVMALTYFNVN